MDLFACLQHNGGDYDSNVNPLHPLPEWWRDPCRSTIPPLLLRSILQTLQFLAQQLRHSSLRCVLLVSSK